MPIAPYPAYAPGVGGVKPYERSFPGGGFVRVRGGVAPPAPATPWTPPSFPPTGTFNPQRELETGEGQRGLEQLEGTTATSEAQLRADYGTGTEGFNTSEKRSNADFSKALELLKESYTRLGTRQQEGANRAGLLQGGALLQAAAKREENEGKEKETKTTAHTRAIEDLNTRRAAFNRDFAPPDQANPLGGRRWQALTTALANAQGNQAFFRQGQQSLAGQEAAERGWPGYSAPAAPKPSASPVPWTGNVRIGNPNVPYLRGIRR